ncbi:lytic polysaccharide monooxygenase, partial [Escherichia sp. HC-CC]
KNTINGGANTFTWKYTAAHATSKWKYYITKKGWAPNKPPAEAIFPSMGPPSGNPLGASKL